MTNEQIKLMTALQLRKAVKDAGKDPMSEEFGKGDPEKMRAFLFALYALPAAPVSISAADINYTPITGSNVTFVGLTSTATKQSPEFPMFNATTVAPPEHIEDRWIQEIASLNSKIEALTLRIATLEQQAKISNGSPAPTKQPADQYAILAPFLHDTDDGPELVLTVSQVPALSLEQKLLVLRLLGEPTESTVPPRILNQRIVTALQKMKQA